MPLVLVAGIVGAELRECPQDKALKAYAVAQLAQREYSRTELRRKLLARVRAGAGELNRTRGEVPEACADSQEDGGADGVGFERIEAVLDWLEAQRYLSAQRFVESRVRLRSERFGILRIRQELAQHGLALPTPTAAALTGSEFERARAIWERKFNSGSGTRADAAKQARFLAGRGFSGEVIRRVLRAEGCTEPIAPEGPSATDAAATRKARATLPR
ncbi:MAG: regulatory protein RecX [Burkholderiaceae bacterium]